MEKDLKFVWGIIITIFLISPFVGATHVNYEWEIDGSGAIETYFENPTIVHQTVTEIDGIAYVQMTFLDETDELQQLEGFVTKGAENWNDDVDMEDIVEALEKAAKYRRGEIGFDDITNDEYDILMALVSITDSEIMDFYGSEIGPVLDSHYNQILSNFYEIEALYITLEKLYPDVYCESRKEVMKKYGLKSVACGLHSKRCYNGRYYAHEGGFDYCIYTDEGIPEEGIKIYLEEINVYESDANSMTPVEIVLFNKGEETLKPVLKVDVKKWENTLGHFEYELEEVPLEGSKTYVIAFDNSGLETGEYTLRATVYLGKKEILEDVDFKILPEGSLAKEGDIVSLKLKNRPLTNFDTVIETKIKNHGEIPAGFQVTGEVYANGEIIDIIKSQKVLIRPGDTEVLNMNYNIPEMGEYEIIVRSNHNMEDMIIFEAVPSTVTGRFMSSPGAAFLGIGIIVMGLYVIRFFYYKISSKGVIELVKPYRPSTSKTSRKANPIKKPTRKTTKRRPKRTKRRPKRTKSRPKKKTTRKTATRKKAKRKTSKKTTKRKTTTRKGTRKTATRKKTRKTTTRKGTKKRK